MSYPIATVHAFIELRALGRSLSDISHQLNIPHSTLGDWNTRYHHDIALQQAIQWDRFEAGSELAREKDLARLILLIQQCQCELDNRPVQSFTNSELMRLLFAARREYFKRRNPLMASIERRRVNQSKRQMLDTPIKPDKTGQKPDAAPNSHVFNNLHGHRNNSVLSPSSLIRPVSGVHIRWHKRLLALHRMPMLARNYRNTQRRWGVCLFEPMKSLLQLFYVSALSLAAGNLSSAVITGDGGDGDVLRQNRTNWAGEGLPSAESNAVAFLSREVPAWSRDNGCYSCHNNGDAVRALYLATTKGFSLSRDVLADTSAWIAKPDGWSKNKGDPGFSDQRLANLQFAAALVSALEAGQLTNRQALALAAQKVATDQAVDGSWPIDAQSTVGSPATYGSTLATFMAWKILKASDGPAPAMRKAENWLHRAKPKNVPDAAALLWASTQSWTFAAHQPECLKIIRKAQTSDGGWGPYADAPPEAFDTALVLLALAELRGNSGIKDLIARGRAFLVKEQNADGSWPATTRPRGGESYAQQLSTTGWATIALLTTRPGEQPKTK